MLRDDIAQYTELSGNDGLHTPIGIIGAYLDGYEKGKADAESDRVSPGNIVINEQGRLKYCPMCGSRMKGEDNG